MHKSLYRNEVFAGLVQKSNVCQAFTAISWHRAMSRADATTSTTLAHLNGYHQQLSCTASLVWCSGRRTSSNRICRTCQKVRRPDAPAHLAKPWCFASHTLSFSFKPSRRGWALDASLGEDNLAAPPSIQFVSYEHRFGLVLLGRLL